MATNLVQPHSVAILSDGNLLVTDTGDNTKEHSNMGNRIIIVKGWSSPNTTSTGNSDLIRLTSTAEVPTAILGGLLGKVKREVSVIVKLPSPGPDDFAVFSDARINMTGTPDTDSYNSENASPPLNVRSSTPNNGNMGSNGEIILGGDVHICGDVRAYGDIAFSGEVIVEGDGISGTEGTTISVTGSAELKGAQKRGTQRISLEDVTMPTNSTDVGIITGSTIILGQAGDTKKGDYYIYTATGINLDGSDRLTINDKVKLYVTGNISIMGNAQINYTGNALSSTGYPSPPAFLIYGNTTCTSINFNNNPFYGAIYAPSTGFTVRGGDMIYGSLIVSSLTDGRGGNAMVIYDEALKESDFLEKKKMEVVSGTWREKQQ